MDLRSRQRLDLGADGGAAGEVGGRDLDVDRAGGQGNFACEDPGIGAGGGLKGHAGLQQAAVFGVDEGHDHFGNREVIAGLDLDQATRLPIVGTVVDGNDDRRGEEVLHADGHNRRLSFPGYPVISGAECGVLQHRAAIVGGLQEALLVGELGRAGLTFVL